MRTRSRRRRVRSGPAATRSPAEREDDEEATPGREAGGAGATEVATGLDDRKIVAVVDRPRRRRDVADDILGHLRRGERAEGQEGDDEGRGQDGPTGPAPDPARRGHPWLACWRSDCSRA